MPVQKAQRPPPRPQLAEHTASTPDSIERALAGLSARVIEMEQVERYRTTADLVVGENRINHGLQRTPHLVALTPTAADATFAWAVTSRDSKQITITVVGVAMDRVPLEIS